MQNALKYTIFRTKWGYFGLAGTKYVLCRTCLPLSEPEKVKSQLLKNLPLLNRESSIKLDKNFFRPIQKKITAYFEGTYVEFGPDIPIKLDGLSPFCSLVLTACIDIIFGQTISYVGLAQKIGQSTPMYIGTSAVRNSTKGRKPRRGKISKKARAVGNALAKNPMPLIVPCHRVVRSNGKIGGFSAPGGMSMKKRLLELERA